MATTEHAASHVNEHANTVAHPVEDTAQKSRLTKLKSAFLYVLIGALVASAITAVLALLLAKSSAPPWDVRSLLFSFYLATASLFSRFFADTRNQVGRKLLPTSILCAYLRKYDHHDALGTWDIIR